jgi:hypothetical protein
LVKYIPVNLPETVSQVLQINAVSFGNFMGDVRQKRDLQGTQTTLVTWSVDPETVVPQYLDGHSHELSPTTVTNDMQLLT